MDQNVTIRSVSDNGLLLHDGSMAPGASGGPIFQYTTDRSGNESATIYALNNAQMPDAAGKTQQYTSYNEVATNFAVAPNWFLGLLKKLREEFDRPSALTLVAGPARSGG